MLVESFGFDWTGCGSGLYACSSSFILSSCDLAPQPFFSIEVKLESLDC